MQKIYNLQKLKNQLQEDFAQGISKKIAKIF